jgi:hypothetical protein
VCQCILSATPLSIYRYISYVTDVGIQRRLLPRPILSFLIDDKRPPLNYITETRSKFGNMHDIWFIQDVSTVKLSRYSHAGAQGKRRKAPYLFMALALDGGECSASRPGRALPPRKDPVTHWIGGKILCLCRK